MAALVIRGESFEATGDMPAWALMKLAKGQKSKDQMGQLASMHDFVLTALTADERVRFEEYMDENPVTFDDLSESIAALMKELSDRPTERPSLSPAGQRPTGLNSRVDSSSPATVRTVNLSSPAGHSVAS